MCEEAALAYFKILSLNLPGGIERIHDSGSSVRDLKTGPPEYEAIVVTARLRLYVSFALSFISNCISFAKECNEIALFFLHGTVLCLWEESEGLD
jgi:hypothetical protein